MIATVGISKNLKSLVWRDIPTQLDKKTCYTICSLVEAAYQAGAAIAYAKEQLLCTQHVRREKAIT
ncbi:hypothetical protein DXT99_19240 [Pontibacter diazotrophicus]|uniref:Uncharacterized protein n=1 Tax=Pontibacter diazotrophicus TaxID=1400979 RepID=A0A3D8L7V9_9BACT|nr:hypothetical protein DXT99_19240 [Pontibacter diazotrophicus]